MKYTINQFMKDFPDDDTCLDAILAIRFSDGICPKCEKETKFHRITGRKQYACQYCGHHVAPCAGTVFEKSSTSLKNWFYAMYLFTSTRHGVPAKELERQLGVTYKCAWRIAHKLRELMQQADGSDPLGGLIEIDETYIGGKKKMPHRRAYSKEGKTPVMGILQREGSVRAGTVDHVDRKTVEPIIKHHVKGPSTIYTDEGRWYKHLKFNDNYTHESVAHMKDEYVRGAAHVNSIEGFWSRLKNSIRGTHVHVSKKHLNKYLSEFAYRYNNRKESNLAIFYRLLAGLARPYQAT